MWKSVGRFSHGTTIGLYLESKITPPCITHYINEIIIIKKENPGDQITREGQFRDKPPRMPKGYTLCDSWWHFFFWGQAVWWGQGQALGPKKVCANTLALCRPPLVCNWSKYVIVICVIVDKQGTWFTLLFLFVMHITLLLKTKSGIRNSHKQIKLNK